MLPSANLSVNKMGLRSKLKNRIKEAIENVKALSKLVSDEASHPGRPQPHMAARNPMWGGQDEAPKEQNTPQKEEPPKSDEVKPVETKDSDGEDFWYLRYEDNEGWDDPNPGQKKD